MKSQKGSVLVEYAIYFPMILCTVVAMLYIGLFHMQESALGHIAEQAAVEAAREAAYPSYKVFHMNSGNDPDFEWGGNAPSKSDVESYYAAQHETIGDLYREVGQIAQFFKSLFGGAASAGFSEAEEKYAAVTAGIKMISAGTIGNPVINSVKMESDFLSCSIKVTIEHQFQAPGVFRYLGIAEENYTLKTVAVKRALNPAQFARNVDLADDMVHFVLRKFGVEDTLDDLLDKTRNVIDAILNP